jgi:RNA polymerase sigma factor (sigma-70 family)
MTTAPGKAKIKLPHRFSDSHLVKECLQGHETAWSTLIGKYKNLIFSIPVSYGFSAEDSADVFQSVCIDLLTELPRLREPNALAGWLIRVARNKCFHRKQAEQRHPVQEVDDLEDLDAPSPQKEPDNVIAQLQSDQMLRDAMLDLSPRCQKLVHMLFFEAPARPYEQVAKELNLALGSIGFIRKRCLDKLRNRLEQMGG